MVLLRNTLRDARQELVETSLVLTTVLIRAQGDELPMNLDQFSSGAPRPHASIHPSAWKWNSRKFTVANSPSTQRQTLDNRLCSTPLASKRSDLVAVVTPLCIKELRLVTVQLPEKSGLSGPGHNRTSP